MRFLLLTQYYPPEIGAPQTRLSAVARHLQALGHCVEVVTALPNHLKGKIFPGYEGQFYVREEIDGVVVHRVWMYAATGAGIKRLVSYLSFMITCLYGLARSAKPDYLFVESPPLFLSLPAFIASRIWGVPFIFNVADLWPDSAKDLGVVQSKVILWLAHHFEMWTYRKAEIVNAVTEGIRDTLVTIKDVEHQKVAFLPNGVDVDLFRPLAPDPELQRRFDCEDRAVFLYAGTHGYAQGLPVLLEAAAQLRNQPIVFVFVGDGPVKLELLRMKAELQLSNVVFEDPKPLEKMPAYYSISTASIVPLRDVPLFDGARPSKLFPSFGCGIPVIYAGKGEGARLIEATESGIVVPPEDADALAAAVMKLACDQKLSRELGVNARKYVVENMAWPSILDNWLRQLGLSTEEGND